MTCKLWFELTVGFSYTEESSSGLQKYNQREGVKTAISFHITSIPDGWSTVFTFFKGGKISHCFESKWHINFWVWFMFCSLSVTLSSRHISCMLGILPYFLHTLAVFLPFLFIENGFFPSLNRSWLQFPLPVLLPVSSHFPSHWDLLSFCLSLENKQASKG